MPRMLEMIRNSQVPANLMQSAARGALSVTPDETIEILVYLALHHKLFGEQARLTLAGWDEKTSVAAASNPHTSAEVLGYFSAKDNLRTVLVPALAENPAVSEETLDGLAVSGSRAVLEVLLRSPRVMGSPRLLQALQTNPHLRPNESAEIGKKAAASESEPPEKLSDDAAAADDPLVAEAVKKYLVENAAELAAEAEKPFQPLGGIEEIVRETVVAPAAASAGGDAGKGGGENGAAVAAEQKTPGVPEVNRDSSLQKISKLGIQGRITLAMRGTKEERAILIRDSTKLVAVAVLDSPKVSDGEVEKFALQKNVLEAVLRAIPMRRKFAKNYNVMRNLVFNPRTPLDLSLGLMKNLMVHDLKNLSGNKEVPDTIRKMALRMFKQKVEKKD